MNLVKQIQTNNVLTIGKKKFAESPLFLMWGAGETFLQPPHGKIVFSGVSDVEQILVRVKQIQTNNVLTIGKKKFAESPLFLMWGAGETFLQPPARKTDFPRGTDIKQILSLVKQIQTNDVLNVGKRKFGKSQ